jgi:hypothetical protein
MVNALDSESEVKEGEVQVEELFKIFVELVIEVEGMDQG